MANIDEILMSMDSGRSNPAEIDDWYTEPSETLERWLPEVEGGYLLLGVGGKIGPDMVRTLQRADPDREIVVASTFENPRSARIKDELESLGGNIKVLQRNFHNPADRESLPKMPNIIWLVGYKFGLDTPQKRREAYYTNVFLPAEIARLFPGSRIGAFSSGAVYPKISVESNGINEGFDFKPPVFYGQMIVGREMAFAYVAEKLKVPFAVAFLELYYSQRTPVYATAQDVALKIQAGQPIGVSVTPATNVISQRDVVDMALLSPLFASNRIAGIMPHPDLGLSLYDGLEDIGTKVMIAGEKVSLTEMARILGDIMEKEPVFDGSPGTTAQLGDDRRYQASLGIPAYRDDPRMMIRAAGLAVKKNDIVPPPESRLPTHFDDPLYISSVGEILSPRTS